MLKLTKALLKVKALVEVFARRFVIVLNPIVVVVPEARKSATRTITWPQCYI